MMVLREPGIALLLSGILLMSCEARFSQYSEQHIVESLGKVGEWNDRVVEQTIQTDLYAKVIGRWNTSWPTIARWKDEASLVGPYGSPESADRPYNISKQCRDGVHRLIEGLSMKETWALQMVDASGKVPSGLLLGHVKWIGTYGECLNASSSKQTEVQQLENGTVLGGYCLVTFGNDKTASAQGPLDLRLGLGICIPRTCNSTDAMALVNLVLSDLTSKIHAVKADCRDNSTLPLDSGAIVVLTILCVLGTLLILGTSLDVISNHCYLEVVIANGHSTDDARDDDEDDDDDDDDVSLLVDHHSDQAKQKPKFILLQTDGSLHRFLVAFSILANAKKIVSMEQTQNNDRSLQALHGIRVISLTWVMLCHTFIFALPTASNPSEILNLIKRFTFQVIINASVSVDTFFVLSGTLLSYFLLRDIRNKGGLRNMNWPKFFFHRFWRLTPLYMMVLAIYTTLVKYLGSGPYWPQESDENCTNNWWTNLLYINNIVHNDKMCLVWSWYLSNDTQFFLLSSIFLALLYKWALLGGIVIFVFMLTSSITTGIITYVHHYPPSTAGVFPNLTAAIPWFNDVYFVPWCRINPYLIGILLGYILYKTNCKLRMHRALVVVGWCLAAVCNLSVLYGLYEVARGHHLSPSISALYGSVNRTAWGLGVAWVILACATGNGGFVNDLLSLPIMQPLSRLTYAAYLIHPMLMLWYYFNLKVPLFIEDITMVYLFFGHMVLTYIGSFVFSIAFESPMVNLERLFLRNHKSND